MIRFILLMIIQGMFINGLKESMNEGMILSWFPKLVKYFIKSEYWQKPFFGCVRCMSSTFGTITFWSAILISGIGFSWQLIPIWICDVFCLVYINAFLYKRM